MPTSPVRSFLIKNLPVAAYPWLVASIRQDEAVLESEEDLITFNLSDPQIALSETIQPENYSPAALALNIITPTISPDWVMENSIPEQDDELKNQIQSVTAEISLPTNEWSLEKAGWIALAIRSEFSGIGSWDAILEKWFSNPCSQHGTVLACLYRMLPDWTGFIHRLLKRNPTAQNIAIVLHAILANPLQPEDQFQQLTELVDNKEDPSFLPISAKLAFFHILQNQRPILAQQIASHYLEKSDYRPGSQEWKNHDPLTWFYDLERELFHNVLVQIVEKNTAIATLVNEWKNSVFTFAPDRTKIQSISTTIQNANALRGEDPIGSIQELRTASNVLKDYLKMIPDPLLADSRIINLIEEMSDLYFGFGQPLEADAILKLASALQPENTSLILRHAQLLMMAKKHEEAIQNLATALSIDPLLISQYHLLAEYLEAGGFWHSALSLRQAILDDVILSESPDPTEEMYKLANCALQANEPERAIEVSQQLLLNNPQDGLAFYYQGMALSQSEKLELALESLKRATEYSFDNPIPWLGLAELHIKQGDTDHAIAILHTAALAVKDNPEIDIRLGEIYINRSAFTQAYEVLSRANQIDPNQAKGAYLYSHTLQQLGHIATANDVLKRALDANPDDQKLIFEYANSLRKLGRDDEALPYLERIVNSEPCDYIAPFIGYAEIILSIPQHHPNLAYYPERAVKALQHAIQIDPNNHYAIALEAEALAAMQDHKGALEFYQKVLDTPLAHDPVWATRLAIGMGSSALALGKPEVAIATLQDVIQNDPENSHSHRLLAEAYLAAHLPENALRSAQSAILIKNEDTKTIAWLCPFIKSLLEQNNSELSKPGNKTLLHQVLDDSIAKVTDLIRVRPDQIGLLISLSELQHLAGDTEAARQSLISILLNDDSQPPDLINSAEHLLALQDSDSAIDCLIKALGIEKTAHGNPTTSTLVKLANVYTQADNILLAVETLDQAIELESNNLELYIGKAKALLTHHQPIRAIECLETAMQDVPTSSNNPIIHSLIAKAHVDDGNLPAAFYHALHSIEAFSLSWAEDAELNSPHLIVQISPLILYTQAAEISRALLFPEKALLLLEKCMPFISESEFDTQEYLHFYNLYNELSLEATGKAVSDLELPRETPLTSTNIRLNALKARLAYQQGELGQAREHFKTTSELITANEKNDPSSIKKDLDPFNSVNDYLGAAEAGLELQDWISAAEFIQKANQQALSNPLVYIYVIRMHTLQAEFERLCQSCDVVRHAPGAEVLAESAARNVSEAINSIHQVNQKWEDQFLDMGLSVDGAYANRWQARANLVIEKKADITADIQTILSNAKESDNNPFLYNADDTAAIIAAYHQHNGIVDEKINQAALFQMARKQSPHAMLLLSIAISLTNHHPIEALNASHLSTKYLAQDNRSISALCHYYQAKLLSQQERYDEALERIEIAFRIWKDEPRWNALAAEIKGNLGDNQAAISHLEDAVKFEPKNIKHHLSLGRAYLNSLATDINADIALYQKRALRNLERATRLAPQDSEAWLALAQGNYQIGDLTQADQDVDRALSIDPTNYGALSLKADIALRSDNAVKACDYARRAALQQPDHPAAHLIHAHALEALNFPEEAIQILQKAIPTSINPLPLQLEHANLIKGMQGVQQALEGLRSLSNQYPDDGEVLKNLAIAYSESDQDELAIEAAQKSLMAEQGSLSVFDQAIMHHLLGHLLRKTGQLDQAIMHLHKATQLNSIDIEPFLELGIAYKERREYQQALQLFQQATEIATKDPRPFYQAGLALKEGKDYRRSEVMLRKAANLAPQDVNIRRQLATVVALNLVHNPNVARINAE